MHEDFLTDYPTTLFLVSKIAHQFKTIGYKNHQKSLNITDVMGYSMSTLTPSHLLQDHPGVRNERSCDLLVSPVQRDSSAPEWRRFLDVTSKSSNRDYPYGFV